MRRELMEGSVICSAIHAGAIAIYVASANFFSSLMFSIFLVYVVRDECVTQVGRLGNDPAR
jgi:hypothetical protein